jgi:hypothetical protein
MRAVLKIIIPADGVVSVVSLAVASAYTGNSKERVNDAVAAVILPPAVPSMILVELSAKTEPVTSPSRFPVTVNVPLVAEIVDPTILTDSMSTEPVPFADNIKLALVFIVESPS